MSEISGGTQWWVKMNSRSQSVYLEAMKELGSKTHLELPFTKNGSCEPAEEDVQNVIEALLPDWSRIFVEVRQQFRDG